MRYFAALIIVATAGSLPAAAQQSSPERAPWDPEPITTGWMFTPAVGFGGFWDSNSTLQTGDEPRTPQWVGLLTPRGDLTFTGARGQLLFGYNGSFEAYNRSGNLTKFDQRGRLQGRWGLAPRAHMYGGATATATPTTDRLEQGTLPFASVGARFYEGDTGLELVLARRTSMLVDYQYQWIFFDNLPPIEVTPIDVVPADDMMVAPGEPGDDGTLIDDDPVDKKPTATALPTLLARSPMLVALIGGGHSNTASGTLRQVFSSRLSGRATYLYRRAVIEGNSQQVNVHDAIGILSYQLAAHTTLEGGAGIARLEVAATGETHRGPSVRAGLTQGVSRNRLQISYERTFLPSWTFTGTARHDEARATFHIPFAAGRGFFEGMGAFRHTAPLIAASDRIVLTSFWSGATVGYSVARWMRMEAFYTNTAQTSTVRSRVGRSRVGVQFVTLKPMRIR